MCVCVCVNHTAPCYIGSCHHDMANPRFVDGGDGLQIVRVAGNMSNKQS